MTVKNNELLYISSYAQLVPGDIVYDPTRFDTGFYLVISIATTNAGVQDQHTTVMWLENDRTFVSNVCTASAACQNDVQRCYVIR